MRQVSKQPANASKTHRPAGVGKSRFRPAFKVGDIVMKAFFDDGVPFSNGMYEARVTKASVAESHGNTTTHYVQFVKQLSVESRQASDNEDETLAVKDGEESYQAHNQKQKNTLIF